MKKYLFLIFILVIAGTEAIAKTPWESYLALPAPENASKVVVVEYTPGATPENHGYLESDLRILRNQVLGGDRESFRLAYRLIENSGGVLVEDLIVILSQTIRAHPEFFLKEMSELNPDRNTLKSILTMPGLEYTDRKYAKRYEIYMRRMALTGVSNISLKDFRDTCLDLIVIH
jgi:hypothetical protein